MGKCWLLGLFKCYTSFWDEGCFELGTISAPSCQFSATLMLLTTSIINHSLSVNLPTSENHVTHYWNCPDHNNFATHAFSMSWCSLKLTMLHAMLLQPPQPEILIQFCVLCMVYIVLQTQMGNCKQWQYLKFLMCKLSIGLATLRIWKQKDLDRWIARPWNSKKYSLLL